MDRQESEFLAAALQTGDPATERRLLAGFHLVRVGCRIADGHVADGAAATAASRALYAAADFAGFETEREALHALQDAVAHDAPRSALYKAYLAYATALTASAAGRCSHQVLCLLERIWTDDCDAIDRLDATYAHGALLTRNGRLAESRDVPLILALRARAAGSRTHLGLARALRAERLALAGNLPVALGAGEQVLHWAQRHRELLVEHRAKILLSMINGRLGRFETAAEHAGNVLASVAPVSREGASALILLANALLDMGNHGDARRSFELAELSPFALARHSAMVGQIDLAVRENDVSRFYELQRRLARRPLYVGYRLVLLRDSALGYAHFGDTDKAQALLEEGMALARTSGYGQDFMQIDSQLTGMGRGHPRRADPAGKAPLTTVLASLRQWYEQESEAIAVLHA